MEDMTDAELGAVWAAVGAVVSMAGHPGGGVPFPAVIMNTGLYRSIEHPHAKILFDGRDFAARARGALVPARGARFWQTCTSCGGS